MVLSVSYERYHAIRVCRDECAERGYSGEAFHKCVEECVKEMLKEEVVP